MKEQEKYTWDNFPESDESPEGMKELSHDKKAFEIKYIHDVEYINRQGYSLKLQIIKPCPYDNAEKYPCIVYVPGSAFKWQEVYYNVPAMSMFASRGFVTAIVQYRGSEAAPFPAQIQDVKTAIRFLRKNADMYQIINDEIFLFGDSSGAHTSLMTAFTAGMKTFDTDDYGDFSAEVKAVIDFYGPTDMSQMSKFPSIQNHTEPDSPEGCLFGGKNLLENHELVQEANPVNYISKIAEIPPVLIMHGDRDPLVPFNQSVLLYEKLVDCSKDTEFYKLKDAKHGGIPFWCNDNLEIVLDFINRHI